MSRSEISTAYDDLLRNFNTRSQKSDSAQPTERQPRRVERSVSRKQVDEPTAIIKTNKDVTEKPAAKKQSGLSDEKKKAADALFSDEPLEQTVKSEDASQKKTAAKKANAPEKRKSSVVEKNAKKDLKKQRKRIRKEKKKKYRKQKVLHALLSLLITFMLLVIIFLASSAFKIPIMGCVNDIIAIDRSDAPVAVYVTEGMKTSQVVRMLEEYDLIYSADFCLLLMSFLDYEEDDEYVAGEHILTADMGVEGMLNSMLAISDGTVTVKVTIPEGFTIDQIAERLYSKKVISAKNALYNAIETYEFPEAFDFLNSIDNADDRYRILEGYMYPDTYEFYVGENPNSVIKRFLNNFNSKWTDAYEKQAKALGLSVDEVLTIASIVQKEASDEKQMYTISSILYNRMASETFKRLQCDSTQDYIAKIDDGILMQDELAALLEVYDTYQCEGLPVGPICNPGNDAIHATLYPDKTDYYYFCHDPDGKIYCARTLDEHSVNVQKYVR